MSWTDGETVRAHLCSLDIPPQVLRSVPVMMSASGIGELLHRGVIEASETIKRLRAEPDGPQAVTLVGTNWAALAHQHIANGEVVVADRIDLISVYRDGVDYAADPGAGRIRRLAGSSISDSATVKVWYLRYDILTRGVDYAMDYGNGWVMVAVGGADISGTTLIADYSLPASGGAETLIPQAIEQAENKILPRLKGGYDSQSTDEGLKTGATELALSIVCRGMAARALSDGLPADEGRSKGWISLAQSYEATAFATLRQFLAVPVASAGARQGNASWEWV